MKVNQKSQEKGIHFIVQHSRHRKDNESSEKKIHPPEQNKKNKKQNSNIRKIGTFCKKKVKKLLRQHLRIILTDFQELNAKKE